jgi:hypothetical protein
MEQLIEKIKSAIKALNEKGIPTPIMRDMISGKPSITYTMLLVSFVLTILASFNLGENQLGLKFDQCLQLLSYVGIGYIGRKYQKGDLTVETEEKNNNESK